MDASIQPRGVEIMRFSDDPKENFSFFRRQKMISGLGYGAGAFC